MASERIKYLAERFLNQTIKEEEKIELANWVNHCSQDEELSRVLEQAWQKHQAVKQMPEDMSERIKALVFLEEPLKQEAESTSIRLIPYRKRSWLWIAAAGVFMIVISSIVYVKIYNQKQPVFSKKEIAFGTFFRIAHRIYGADNVRCIVRSCRIVQVPNGSSWVAA